MRGRVSTRAHDRAVTDGAALKIPKTLESAIDAAVSRHLEAELADRSLLLTSADLAIAEAKTAVLGRRLMTSVLKQCYPEADGLTVEFERTGDIGRIGAALAFGAVTSRVFASSVGDRSRRRAAIELLCGTFNLAIGLVDGICDADVARASSYSITSTTRTLSAPQAIGVALAGCMPKCHSFLPQMTAWHSQSA